MELNTTSAVIAFARKLEEDEARLFDDLARQYPVQAEAWLSFAKENKRYISDIERAYYGVITDALEGNFAFKIDSDNYLPGSAEALKQVFDAEDKIARFYADAAEQSKPLLADIPRAFAQVGKKRSSRRQKLAGLRDSCVNDGKR